MGTDRDFIDKKTVSAHELEKELSNVQLVFSKKDERLRLLVWLHRVKQVYTKQIIASTGMLTSLQEEGVCFYLNNSESTDDADKRLLAGVLIDKMEFLETTLQKTDQYLSMLFDAPESSIPRLEQEFPLKDTVDVSEDVIDFKTGLKFGDRKKYSPIARTKIFKTLKSTLGSKSLGGDLGWDLEQDKLILQGLYLRFEKREKDKIIHKINSVLEFCITKKNYEREMISQNTNFATMEKINLAAQKLASEKSDLVDKYLNAPINRGSFGNLTEVKADGMAAVLGKRKVKPNQNLKHGLLFISDLKGRKERDNHGDPVEDTWEELGVDYVKDENAGSNILTSGQDKKSTPSKLDKLIGHRDGTGIGKRLKTSDGDLRQNFSNLSGGVLQSDALTEDFREKVKKQLYTALKSNPNLKESDLWCKNTGKSLELNIFSVNHKSKKNYQNVFLFLRG